MTIFRGPDGGLYTIEEWISDSWRRWWGHRRYVAVSYPDGRKQIQLDTLDNFTPVAFR